MATFLKRLFWIALAGVAALMLVRTFLFTSRQISVPAVEVAPVDPAAAQRLSAAIQLASVATDEGVDTLALRQLDTLARSSFPLVDSLLERIPLENSLSQLWRWPGRNAALEPILLMGHLDVVPVDAASGGEWEEDPFSGAIRDGYLWGRGSIDDKMTVWGLLEATEQLLAEGFWPERSIYLAFGHDEEIGGADGAAMIAAHLKKENVRLEFVLDEGQLVLTNALSGLAPPLAMIGVAEKGYVTLELKAQLAEGGHSSMPPRETATGVLSEAIVRLQEHPLPARIDGATAALLDYVGPEMSPPFRFLFANRWLTGGLLKRQFSQNPPANALIRTTTAPTVLHAGVKDNVLPATARALVNFRILPGDTHESVMEEVRRIIADERVSVSVRPGDQVDEPSPVSTTEAFGYGLLEKTIRQLFPEAVVAPALVIAQTDSRHYQPIARQVYRFQPVLLDRTDLSRIHGQNERLSIEGYERAIRFYRQLVVNGCGG
ncbi:MAG: M20 family peptidase [Lewinella sp.]|nr:M20 family peptidase [Lewinella sp.]